MASSSSTTQRWLMGAIAATAVAIVALALVLALHHSPAPVTTSIGAGSATTAPTALTAPTTGGTATSTATDDTSPATTVLPPTPHFGTPEAAMTYLTAAWNSGNTVNLDHVTNPAARAQLAAMHGEATDLRLDHCTPRPQGDYACVFDHNSPAGTSTTLPGGIGHAYFLVGPATRPGWYMTVFQGCG
jgi:hypothetical protein